MIPAILAGLFFVLQNLGNRAFSKYFERGFYQLMAVNSVALAIASAALLALSRPKPLTGPAALFAVAFGALFVAAISVIMLTFSRGPLGMCNLIIDMYIMPAVLAGILIWREKLTPVTGVAMALTVTALALIAFPDGKDDKQAKKGWLFLAIASMLLNSGLSLVQKSALTLYPEMDTGDFTFWSIAAGAAMSLLLFLGMKLFGKKRFSPGQPVKRLPLVAAAEGLGTAAAYWLENRALTVAPSVVVFPVVISVNVGVLMLISIIFYGEKLSLRRGIAFAAGLAGIIMMNL